MALIAQPILDFSDKDFASLRLRLQGLARSTHPEWTDFNEANFGNILLELMAFTGDVMTFYQDAQAREQFWPTVSRRVSAIRLGRLINFTLPGPTPATGVARFSLPAAHVANILIKPNTRLRSNDPLNPLLFITTNTENAVLTAGNTSINVPVEQAEQVQDEVFESTDGPNQEFVLSRSPYLDNSAVVSGTSGSYTVTQSFLDVLASSARRYVELVDQEDRAHLRFGNGVLGEIPIGSITVSYKITQGSEGNIEVGQLSRIVDTIFDVNGNSVSGLVVTNVAETTGGADRMTISQARSLAPASLRALSRSVTRTDFETHASEITGVGRVVMLSSNEDGAVQENSGLLLVVARGARLESGRFKPATPTQALLDDVIEQVTVKKPATITFRVDALAAPFLDVNISTLVHFEKGADKAATADDIRASLEDFFASNLDDGTNNTDIDFGANILNDQSVAVAEIAWSDVLNAIRDVDGVRRIDDGDNGLRLNGLRQSLVLGLREFPRLRQIQIFDGANNTLLLSVDVGT